MRGPTQAPAISPPPHATSLQRPICLFPCRGARLQNFGVQATSSPSGAAIGARIVRNPILQTLNLRSCEPSTGTQLGMNPGVLWTSAPQSELLESCSQGPTRDRTSPAVGPKRSCGGCFLHEALWVSNHSPNNGKCLGVPDLQEHRMGLSPHDQCLSYSHISWNQEKAGENKLAGCDGSVRALLVQPGNLGLRMGRLFYPPRLEAACSVPPVRRGGWGPNRARGHMCPGYTLAQESSQSKTTAKRRLAIALRAGCTL